MLMLYIGGGVGHSSQFRNPSVYPAGNGTSADQNMSNEHFEEGEPESEAEPETSEESTENGSDTDNAETRDDSDVDDDNISDDGFCSA